MTDLERDAELMALAVRYDQSRHWTRAAIGLFLGSAVILSAVWFHFHWIGAAKVPPRKPPTPQVQVQQFVPEAASRPVPLRSSGGI
jgi:hypothetical protein